MFILQFQIRLYLFVVVTNLLTNPILLLYTFIPCITCNLLNHRKNVNVHCLISIFSSSPLSFQVLLSLFSHSNHLPYTLLPFHNISSTLMDSLDLDLHSSSFFVLNIYLIYIDYTHLSPPIQNIHFLLCIFSASHSLLLLTNTFYFSFLVNTVHTHFSFFLYFFASPDFFSFVSYNILLIDVTLQEMSASPLSLHFPLSHVSFPHTYNKDFYTPSSLTLN